MKHQRLAAALLAACLQAAGAAFAADQASATATVETAAESAPLTGLWSRLWEVRQLDALVALYEEDATFYTAAGERVVGRAAIRKLLAAMMQRGASLQLRTLGSHGEGGLAYDAGAYDQSTGGQGATPRLQGYYLAVWRRQPEGQWLIAQQMWSVAPQPGAAAALAAAAPAAPVVAAQPGTAAAAVTPPAPVPPPAPAAAPAPAESAMADVNISSAPPPAPPRHPYDRAGCDRGLFKGPAPAKWLDRKAWEQLQTGMSMAQVEAVVGVEHYDEVDHGRQLWEYGRCGRTFEGIVVFDQQRVSSWNAPER